VLHQLFAANHASPSVAGLVDAPGLAGTAVAFHAPTLLLRDIPLTREVVALETQRDPDNAEREYGARFMSTGSATFFDPASIVAAVKPGLLLPTRPNPGDLVSFGADYAFARNSSALVAIHRTPDGRYRVGEVLERKPEKGAPLKPSVIVREFAATVDMHHGTYTMADGHYRQTVDEFMPSHQTFVDAPKDPSLPFVRARALLREGVVDLPDHPRLLRQLRETKSRPGLAGKVHIVLPKWPTGEHGDIASAFVLSLYHAASGEVVPDKPAKLGTEAWEEVQRDARRQALEEKAKTPYWRRR
jgi:hypothetical protein